MELHSLDTIAHFKDSFILLSLWMYHPNLFIYQFHLNTQIPLFLSANW